MTVTLSNFTTVLPAQQVKKGQEYFDANAVEDILETGPGSWLATVRGGDEYEVEIELDDETITYVSCTCPHDVEFCKHVIAALFDLQFSLKIEAEPEKTKGGKSGGKKAGSKNKPDNDIDAVLKNSTEKELRDFVKKMAAKDKTFRNQFLLQFDLQKQEDSCEKFRNIISKTAALYTKHGFIDYNNSSKALKPVIDILKLAEANFAKGHYRVTFDACFAVIAEVNDMVSHMDDSNGMASASLNMAFDLLYQLNDSPDAPYAIKEELFAYALKEYIKPAYAGVGIDDSLLELAINTAKEEEQLQQVLKTVDKALKSADSDYKKTYLLKKRMEVLTRAGKTGEAEKILNDNLDIWEFREEKVKQHIANEEYLEAKTLLKQELMPGKLDYHLERRINEWLFQIALLEKDTGTLRKNCLDYYFKQAPNHKYYLIYRNTFSEEEWPAEYELWMKKFQKAPNFYGTQKYSLAEIYKTEKKWDLLLALLQNNPEYEFAEWCKPHLIKEYAPQLLVIYRQALLEFAEWASNRDYYKVLANRLKVLQKDFKGKDEVYDLVNLLLVTYNKRPAMMQELAGLVKEGSRPRIVK